MRSVVGHFFFDKRRNGDIRKGLETFNLKHDTEINGSVTQNGWRNAVAQEKCGYIITEEECKLREEIHGTNHFAEGTLLKLYFG